MTRNDAQALDTADPLAALRDQFDLPAGLIYLDGNSLGPLPRATARRVAEAVQQEWGQQLIGAWSGAGWIDLPQRIGDRIGKLLGAGPGELVVADSTSVNLYKVLSAALSLVQLREPASGEGRRVILTEAGNFPTDLYIAQSLAAERGFELQRVDPADLRNRLSQQGNGTDVAVLMLTHVNYRSGQLHDMAALSAAAHAAGALTVWDLAHSVGALPVDLHEDGADFAIGCGYKYLNGGPGAPAFVWAHPRHLPKLRQPLAGWMGHAAPFDFSPGFEPASGMARFLCGTPPVLSMVALACGVDTVLAAEAHGGMAALRKKSLVLTRLFADKVSADCPLLQVVSPAADSERGSQVCLTPIAGQEALAWPVVQALIARGVVGDFRAGDPNQPPGSIGAIDILRFGFTPLTLRHVDAWDAAEHLRQVIDSGEWRQPAFLHRNTVT